MVAHPRKAPYAPAQRGCVGPHVDSTVVTRDEELEYQQRLLVHESAIQSRWPESHIEPDLTRIRNQPAEVILLHIIVPEYEIMPVYTAYNVETKSGETYAGLLAAETPGNITLRMAQGIEQQIPRASIASMTTSRLSLMPQEMEKAMTKQELADLLAFLKGQ